MQPTKQPRILQTKLRPPQSQLRPLARDRLLDALADVERYRLGLVTAPAGSGKTTTLAQLYCRLAQNGVGAAWLSIDRYDNEPHRFLAGLIAACQRVEPGLADEAERLLAVPDAVASDVSSALASALVECPRPLALILDDYHEIGSTEVHGIVDFLLQYLPSHVCFVIGSRQVPPLALGRLRVRGWLRALAWDDLRFTLSESSRYLREARRLALTDAQIAALNDRAEGWIAGLQLAAMSLRAGARAEDFVRAFSGAQVDVADYLMQDVFQRQPPEVRDFLLRTSVLERLSAPLCDKVLERSGGQAMLERLDADNLFLFRLDNTRDWYRYHHLFADFLRTRLTAADPAAPRELARRAKAWFEANQLPLEALAYAVRGELYDDAARLLGTLGRELFYRGEFKELRYWLEQLPAKQLRRAPALCLLHGWALAYLGEFALARERLAWASAAVAGGDPDAAGVQAEIAVLRVAIGVIQADEPELTDIDEDLPGRLAVEDTGLRAMAHVMVGYALRAGQRLEPALAHVGEAVGLSDRGAAPLVNLLARFNQGALLHLMGRVDAAERMLRDSVALAVARRWHRGMGMAFLRVQHAIALQEQYRLADALAELNQAIDLLETTQAFGYLGVAYTERARLHLLRDDPAAAREDTARAAALAENHGVTRVRFRIALLEARAALAQNRVLPARTALRPFEGLLESARLSERHEAFLLTHLRVLLAEGRHDEVLAWARRAVASSEAGGRRRNQCEFLLLQALAYRSQSEHAAKEALEQALSLAEAGGIVTPFLLIDRPWLERLARAGHRYIAHLLRAFDTHETATAASAAEPLHPREQQILRLLAQGLRNKEIGQRLFLSEETVKWYLKKLFRKLDVATRTQAIRWARDHGLLA